MTTHRLDDLARDVTVLDSRIAKMRGAIGRSLTDRDCLVFRYGSPATRAIHMVGVRQPLTVVWLCNGQVMAAPRLRPWTGVGRNRADTVLEFVGDPAMPITEGDRIEGVPA